MPIKADGVLKRLLHMGVLARWKLAKVQIGAINRSKLRRQRCQARELKAVLQEFCHLADDRLALPQIGSPNFVRPVGTDWSWRPMLWRLRADEPGRAPVRDRTRFGGDLGLFHDCPQAEITIKQLRNLRDTDISAFALALDVLHFDGSYLSIVVDLPKDSCVGLKKQHLIQLAVTVEKERPVTIMARLNVRNGPNTEQILLTLPEQDDHAVVEFDLAYTQLNEKRAEKMWIDLMFDNPRMNRIILRDLTISRYPRAQI